MTRSSLPLIGAGYAKVNRSPAWALVIQPLGLDATIAAWRGSGMDWDVSEQTRSVLAGDYGLDDVPGAGAWVREGTLVRRLFRCNTPDAPEEWDEAIDWENSVWRRPTMAELAEALMPKKDEDRMLLAPKDQLKLDGLFEKRTCFRAHDVLYAVENRGVWYVNGHRVAQEARTPQEWLKSLSVKYSSTWLRHVRAPRQVIPILTEHSRIERVLREIPRITVVCGNGDVRDPRRNGWLWLSREQRQRLYREGNKHGPDYQLRSVLQLREAPGGSDGLSLEQAEHRGWFLSHRLFPEFSKAWCNEEDHAAREGLPEQIVLLNGFPEGVGVLVTRDVDSGPRFLDPQQHVPS